jgi:hypothetical protein
MRGVEPRIHVFHGSAKGVDGRNKSGHDGRWSAAHCVSRMPVNFHCESSSMA